jgi:hypothetical protein
VADDRAIGQSIEDIRWKLGIRLEVNRERLGSESALRVMDGQETECTTTWIFRPSKDELRPCSSSARAGRQFYRVAEDSRLRRGGKSRGRRRRKVPGGKECKKPLEGTTEGYIPFPPPILLKAVGPVGLLL